MKTYWLSMHASYACCDSGACCSAGWPIPLERSRAAAVGLLRTDGSWLLPAPDAPGDIAGTLAVSRNGHCVFHFGHGCEIQGAYGHRALPSACRHFPREVLIDARGAFVTLSHYCPTALDLLLRYDGPVEIVEGPPAVPEGEPEGLDARNVLPPLLTERVLMDFDAYAAWEAHMVAELTGADARSPEEVLDDLACQLATLMLWRPGCRPLIEVVSSLRRRAAPEASQPSENAILRRYLAARAFASWMPYQAGGAGAVLNCLRLVLDVVRTHRAHMSLGESIRETDLKLIHLMPRDELAARCQTPRGRDRDRWSRTPAAP